MCVAIVKPSGVPIPERNVLKICFKNNPDGAGFAYCRNGKNYICKGFFTFSHFWNALMNANIKKNEAALIHFRVATHGNIDKFTCHPFLITDNYEDMRKTNIVTKNGDIMIHNGMLNFELDDSEVSDSMFLAKYLSKFDLFNDTNKYIFNLALLNNNKSKMNRVAILRINNTVEMYGFKEPWEIVNGCYFSNKSYNADFSRGYTCQNYYTNNNSKNEKLEYDEDEIQSKKISFCFNHDKTNCNELGIYAVHNTDKDYDIYCDDCVTNVDYFNCKCCEHSFYSNQISQIDGVCKYCFENNSEFIIEKQCDICNYNMGKHLLFTCEDDAQKSSVILCEKCFSKAKPFKCSECLRWYPDCDESIISNLCQKCYATKKLYNLNECTYCKSKHHLLRTSYSTVCEKCFHEKNGKTCFICDKKYIWGDEHIGNFDICPTCSSKQSNSIILENFKSFALLNSTIKKNLAAMFNKVNDDKKMDILEVYKYNNYFDKMQNNVDAFNDIINKK